MSAKRIQDRLLIVFAFPLYMAWQIARYANIRERWPAKIGMFIVFMPLIIFCSAAWCIVWVLMLQAAFVIVLSIP
jgi:hypothetical protein